MKGFTRKNVCKILTLLLISMGAVSAADARADFFGNLFAGIEREALKVDREVKKGFDQAGREIEGGVRQAGTELEKAGKEIEKGFNQAGREIENGAKQVAHGLEKHVWEELKKDAIKQHGGLISDTASNWTTLGRTNAADFQAIAAALNGQDEKAALRAIANLAKNNLGLKKLIENAQEGKMGSLTVLAGGSGAAGVGANGAVGVAISVDALVHFFRYGSFPADKSSGSLFTSGGVVVGATGGGSVDLAVGFTVSSPHELSGPAFDINLELDVIAGGNSTISFDPTNGVSFDSFTIGVTAGAKVELSVGVSYTHVLVKVYDPFDGFGIRSAVEGSLTPGVYQIQVIGSGRHLHVDGYGDKLLSTRWQPNDDFTKFIVDREPLGAYRIRVKSSNRYLHVDGSNDKLASTRWQANDDFTRFQLEQQATGDYRIRVKASGGYLGSMNDLVSSQLQSNDSFSRFRFVKVN